MHHHALIMTGAISVYLSTIRDASGIIGPVDHRFLDERYIRDQIRQNPLVTYPDA
jgi:arginine/lysine/ornithine decarboxylase